MNNKKILFHIRIMAFAAFLAGMSYSCTYYEDEFISEDANFAFFKVYESESDFLGTNFNFDDESKAELSSVAANHEEYYTNHDKTVWVDARNQEGYSTWGQPVFTLKFDKGKTTNSLDFHKHNYTGKITLSSPPAHLHLCLDSWDEIQVNKLFTMPKTKTWKIVSVTDINGKSLADDPDWTNYTDNRMSFKKTNQFVYSPGIKRSAFELDLFGTENEHANLSGTYKVNESSSGKVTLIVSFPKFTEELEVVSSSWTNLLLKGTVKGKTGFMELVPTSY